MFTVNNNDDTVKRDAPTIDVSEFNNTNNYMTCTESKNKHKHRHRRNLTGVDEYNTHNVNEDNKVMRLNLDFNLNHYDNFVGTSNSPRSPLEDMNTPLDLKRLNIISSRIELMDVTPRVEDFNDAFESNKLIDNAEMESVKSRITHKTQGSKKIRKDNPIFATIKKKAHNRFKSMNENT